MSQSAQNQRIAYSIVRHLQSQMSSGVLDEDGKEGVESEWVGLLVKNIREEWCDNQ